MMAALCACFLLAGSVSAQWQRMVPEPAPVAGYSPNFASPQPITGKPLATLTEDANRLIRWQGWLDVDAFSTSVLNQMQKQVHDGVIEIGSFTTIEPGVDAAVTKAKAASCNKTFRMNRNLREDGAGETFQGKVTLYCWLYRHNYVDTGLYQLYISVKGKMLIGEECCEIKEPHWDIQSLAYEFGPDLASKVLCPVIADVEIWRGAVVRVDSSGAINIVGNEAGAVTREGVEEVPMALWERAPSLENNPHYNPKRATGAAFVEPLNRKVTIPENAVQARSGSVQMEQRVKVVPYYKYRAQ